MSDLAVYHDMSDVELRAEMRRLAALKNPATMAKYLDPRHFQIRAHTRLIGQTLGQLGPDDRLLITTPPQVGKSTLVSQSLPFWWLAREPRAKVVLGSYAASLALKHSRVVRRHVFEHGAQFGLRIQRGEASVYDWSTTAGGGMRAVGVGGSLTGFPATLAICDDPHKDRKEADSRLMREHVWDWWSSTFMSRLRPGTPVVLLMTRWHEDDLAGRLMHYEGIKARGGKWIVLHLPAISSAPDDPLHRAPGDPLTHPAIPDSNIRLLTAHWSKKKAETKARDWGALYQGDPKPAEGALLSREQLERARHFQEPPAPMRVAVAVDPSGGGRDEAGIIGGYLGEDQRLYWTHDRTAHMSSAQWSRAACQLAYDTDAQLIVVETNFGGDQATLAVRTAWTAMQHEELIPEGTLCPRVKPVRAKVGKLLRADPIAQQVIEDRIRFGFYLPDLENEWATWQPDDPDSPGRIDASVYLGYALLRVPGAGKAVTTATDISRASVQPRGGAPVRRTY